ncbi:MAG: OmpH family outer membrane protein [bacterium]|nr:OmpH family outer membrane protein [bacterium]
MKKSFTIFVAVLALGFATFAQTKIGVLNSQEILQKSNRGMQVVKKLENMQKDAQTKLLGMQEEMKKLQSAIASPALSTEAKEAKKRELEDNQIKFKRFYDDIQKRLRTDGQKEIGALEKLVTPIIREYGNTQGFTMLLDQGAGGLFYHDSAIDITAEIVKAVNAKIPAK